MPRRGVGGGGGGHRCWPKPPTSYLYGTMVAIIVVIRVLLVICYCCHCCYNCYYYHFQCYLYELGAPTASPKPAKPVRAAALL